MSDRLVLVFHVVAAVVFVGNIAAGLFWTVRARRSGDARVLGHTFTSLVAADLWITTPAVVVLTLTGIVAAVRMGFPILGTGWILWSIVALSLSGAIFAARVMPLQKRIAAAFDETRGERSGEERRSLTEGWMRWAHVSLILAAVALVLMVAKPVLPALVR